MPMNSNEIRRTFLDYFKAQGHTEVDSSPLVPRNDPTMMFTNSGMVQFKNVFTGAEKRGYTRATTAQKCARAGGKHNDLDNVGYTGRHLTFFEMLGNFSFGDYFKEEAIAFAWELSTKHFGLPKDRILATVYSEDDEAYDIWKKLGFTDSRIIRIGDNKGARYASDNFWMMGETGPCGPCSELFFDQGDKVPGGPPGSADENGDRYLEFWNNVFMQFERGADGNMVKLPKPSIDTGMGLERINGILNGHTSLWETDSMRQLIEAAAHATSADPDGPQKFSLRVIADHLRSTSFLVAEGVLPSNEGRGYVLRRIMRRAMRHAHLLGAKDPLMFKLVPSLVAQMGGHYHELERAQALITETLKGEEIRFKATLERGLKLLDEEEGRLGAGEALPGEVAFKLYDTFGFPLDLTQDVLRGHNRPVDLAGFDAAMQRQKAEARKSAFSSGETATQKVWFELKEEFGATEFLGYDAHVAEGQVLAILKGEQRLTEADASAGEVSLLVNQTPFYGESGGQVGDVGTVSTANGAQATVRDVVKHLGLFVHHITVTEGALKPGDTVKLMIDEPRRAAIRGNHSATHLLHEALRRTLGEHVSQKGSEVSERRLRFDISHGKALSADETRQVEALVNERILLNAEVESRLMSQKEALDYGAMALFGEKYGDEVRVLGMGGVDPGTNRPWSLELCGGTHVTRTGDIGLFKITADSAVSAGVRRIEGVTGIGALQYLQELQQMTGKIGSTLNVQPAQAVERIAQLMEERRAMEREIADLRRKVAMSGQGNAAAPAAKMVNGIRLDARLVDLPARDLKPLADDLRKQIGSGVVALVSTNEGKLSVVVSVSDDLKDKQSAVAILQAAGLKGGGRADMAQAGGGDITQAGAILEKIELGLAG